ncbi:hypothetical protein [Pseudonocardia endophytica]|uniref:hypothetical protein n=1 Tax=Pseudonocardia endophytica TaxID=401976 RepID=UPI001A9CFA7F|nr:hypothetical protein [Pseudonocardia endophytica]
MTDVDGTLVDSVYHHAVAHSRAFAAHGPGRDSPWDVRARPPQVIRPIPCAVGGRGEDELREAAVDVDASLDDLRSAIPRLPGR